MKKDTNIYDLLFKNKIPLILTALYERQLTANELSLKVNMSITDIYRYLTRLRSFNLIHRTPTQPAYFWLTEDGIEISSNLNKILNIIEVLEND